MSTIVQKQKSIEPYKSSTYEEFIYWLAMPTPGKVKMGIETQGAFCDFYKVSERTLLRWKDDMQFRARVRSLRDKWAFEKTQGVIEGIYKSAIRGNDKSQKLWMQVFEGFAEKTENTQILKVEYNINDHRFMIDALPEQLKQKHYGYLQELLDDSAAIASAIQHGEVPESVRNAPIIDISTRPTDEIPGEAYQDAQIISRNDRANAVARSYQKCVCENMERKVSENNHKSAERWGQE